MCKISSTQRFEAVVAYLRRVLKVGERDSVFLYVNSSFAPALDEVVGNLHRVSGSLSCLGVEVGEHLLMSVSQCFKDSKDQLIVTYSMTPAFG